MPPETPPPTYARCPEHHATAKALREIAEAQGHMKGTLEAILTQAKLTNGSIGTLDARADTHRSRLDIHNGRIKALEGGIKATKKQWETWTERGWRLAVAILLAVIAYWNFGN